MFAEGENAFCKNAMLANYNFLGNGGVFVKSENAGGYRTVDSRYR